MSKVFKLLLMATTGLAGGSCTQNTEFKMGTYGYDTSFLTSHGIEYTELTSEDGSSRVMIVPSLQARVMTTSAGGPGGDSYGWINYRFIEQGHPNSQFNPYGGEERFWFGPEGGPYSLFFRPGAEQVYENWQVPASIDTEAFEPTGSGPGWMSFGHRAELQNAAGTNFTIGIDRRITLLDAASVEADFGIAATPGTGLVAYRTDNTITNLGDEAWTREGGLVSIWMLGMFNPTPSTTVFIPYRTDGEGPVVNDEYFGKIPADRLQVDEGMIYFKIDGLMRTKLGIPKDRALPMCGSYDSSKGVLTLLWCTIPGGEAPYVNGQWGPQNDPFAGDVVNSYNDGPTEDGTVMGPFYEIETSSPGAELSPGESLTHTQKVVHLQGTPEVIDGIVRSLFGVGLRDITGRFS